MENTQTENQQKEKKKSKLPFIITIIVIILLFAIGSVIAILTIKNSGDPDIVILNLINENAKGDADNSYKGYHNAKNVGYVLDILTLSKESRVILWDSLNNCYALYDGEKLISSPAEHPSKGTDMWLFVNKIPAESPFSVYWVGTNKVTEEVVVDDGDDDDTNNTTIEKNYYYTEHVYAVQKSGLSRTYTCTEDGCGYTYTVKVK